jgi:2,5-dioxopentanoate dehydrogenase
MSSRAPVLVAGKWQDSTGTSRFQSANPSTLQNLEITFPVSDWAECDRALSAAFEAAQQLRSVPVGTLADFLDQYAALIDSHNAELAELAHSETALPIKPRLSEAEIPRTSGQLRQAAAAARTGSWAMATIDTKANIRSCYEPIGPVAVFGPNNFPFAFNSISGGDFAAAIAAGNPVIGKANTSHPATTRRLAELAFNAVHEVGLPPATVQLLYRLDHADGAKFVGDHRLAAIGYTGSRKAGLALKSAADAVGKPIYLELSSVNPVVILPGALAERGADLVGEFVGSVLMGTGQFCTNPGLIVLIESVDSASFVSGVSSKFQEATPGTLLSTSVQNSLTSAIKVLTGAGAELLCGGQLVPGRCSVTNTLLRVDASKFLKDPEVFQTEAFGNASLVVVAKNLDEAAKTIASLEGNLTGCIYSAKSGVDDEAYDRLAGLLSQRVGRLLNDKMPTGVAVSPAMNHGGPFPATGHPGFTAVGIPGSMLRFGKLTCYDAVRPGRLPNLLQDKNPTGKTWRLVDLNWTTSDVATS